MTESYDADGNKIPHRARSGPLDGPQFGELPDIGLYRREPGRIQKAYSPMFPVMRDHEGQWAKVAEFKLGSKSGPAMTKKQSHRKAVGEQAQIRRLVAEWFPLERWTVSVRTTPDTWGDREVWLRYEGTWTVEERDAEKKRRRELWDYRLAMGARRRAERDAAARAQIVRMQSRRGGAREG